MDSDDIATLMARTAPRDRVAFSVLYQETSAKLFGVCLCIFYDRGDAEEALQEVYVEFWRDADRFAIGKGSPISGLIAIARNHAIDVLRARKPVSRDIEEVLDIADSSPDPETVAVELGERKRIDQCSTARPHIRYSPIYVRSTSSSRHTRRRRETPQTDQSGRIEG